MHVIFSFATRSVELLVRAQLPDVPIKEQYVKYHEYLYDTIPPTDYTYVQYAPNRHTAVC